MNDCAIQPCDLSGIVAFEGEVQRYCLHHAYQRRRDLDAVMPRAKSYRSFAVRTLVQGEIDTSHLLGAV